VPQDGTPAAELPEQLSPAVRQRRRDELVSIQQGISEGFAQGLVGRELDVLVDGVDEDGGFIGRTQWDAPDGARRVRLGGGRGERKTVSDLHACCSGLASSPSPDCHHAPPPAHAPPLPLPHPPNPPAVDPIVFLAEPEDPSLPRLEVGQMRRARVDGASLFDLDATVVA
jgi:hypothetical protein